MTNPTGRFEREKREAVPDRTEDLWWSVDDDLPPLRTTVAIDSSRSIITRNQSPDVPFDRSINPYRGCEHGCVYCFARPSHAILGLSPGLDFETKLLVKPEAARLLAQELRKSSYRCQPIAIGTNTDPYQPVERDHKIMRAVLETLLEFRHPVTITTKSALVIRDLDILSPMAALGLVSVALSITTLDPDLARRLEPRAATPDRRLQALEALNAAGIPTRVMMAPMIPALNDSELESILAAGALRGARHAGWILLRLPYEIKELFDQWLAHHRPDRRDHVLSLIRQARGGQLNDSQFGDRMVGSGPMIAMFRQRFALACRKLGLNQPTPGLRCDLFAPPPQKGDQMSLGFAP